MRKFLLGLLIGLLVGVAGALLMPRDLTRRVPAMVGAAGALEGEVVAKRRLPERLLLTLRTPDGSTLATFTARLDEIDLLVDAGDTVALAARYEPFVEDPLIRRVEKPRPGEEAVAPAAGEEGAAAETAPETPGPEPAPDSDLPATEPPLDEPTPEPAAPDEPRPDEPAPANDVSG